MKSNSFPNGNNQAETSEILPNGNIPEDVHPTNHWRWLIHKNQELREQRAALTAEVERLKNQYQEQFNLARHRAVMNAELREVLKRIAMPKRPDGTYNLSREACEELARDTLGWTMRAEVHEFLENIDKKPLSNPENT